MNFKMAKKTAPNTQKEQSKSSIKIKALKKGEVSSLNVKLVGFSTGQIHF